MTDRSILSNIPRLPSLEEVRAERARRRLVTFVEQAWPVVEPATPFVKGWHVDCICDHLEAVSRGDIPNLLINIPPRCQKSLSVSVFWPVWEWLSQPALRWLFNSYADTLSIRDSLKCRRIIQSPWHQERWGHIYKLTTDQNVKARFENDKTGYRIAASVGGSNTGEGGDRVICDDPHNVIEGESEVKREETLRWWFEVMSTRLNDEKTGRRVIVMQRVHHQDLSGAVLERGGWHHLCLPMEYVPRVMVQPGYEKKYTIQPHDDCTIHSDPRTEEGQLLWPERLDEQAVTRLKTELGPYAAEGQLQQRPTPREGVLFKVAMFRPLPVDFDEPRQDGLTMRQRLKVGQFWDLAWSERESSDYTAAVTCGIDASGNVYILNAWRIKADEVKLSTELAHHITQTRPSLVAVEQGAFAKAATTDLVKRVNRQLVHGVGVIPIPARGDKYTRAQLPAGRGQVGMLYADTDAPWWPAFLSEVLDFPKGAHDDWVDALSGATQLVIERVQAPLPQNSEYGFNEQQIRRGNSWVKQAIDAQEVKVIRRGLKNEQ